MLLGRETAAVMETSMPYSRLKSRWLKSMEGSPRPHGLISCHGFLRP
jgi:hypothetical protein